MNFVYILMLVFLLMESLEAVNLGNIYHSLSCPNGWKLFQDSCYKAFTESQDFYDAAITCHNNGGYLVTIKSIEEHNYVRSLDTAKQGLWIGVKRDYYGDFRYIDDHTKLDFYKWGPGQPDNGGGNGCVLLGGYEWNEKDCNTWSTYPFVCERAINKI